MDLFIHVAVHLRGARTGRRGRMGRIGGKRAYEKKGNHVSSSPPFVPFSLFPRSRATKVHSHAALPDKTEKENRFRRAP
jgi:hypothetical protein